MVGAERIIGLEQAILNGKNNAKTRAEARQIIFDLSIP